MPANPSFSTKLETQIRNEKKRITQRFARLQELQQQFLLKVCPLKAGSRIEVETGRGSETGEVADVRYDERDGFGLNLNPDAPSGWHVSGKFLNKKTGKLSERSFSLNSFEHSFVNGIWRKTPPPLSSS